MTPVRGGRGTAASRPHDTPGDAHRIAVVIVDADDAGGRLGIEGIAIRLGHVDFNIDVAFLLTSGRRDVYTPIVFL
jgi:hypothetical protein